MRSRNQRIRQIKANHRAGSVVEAVESQCSEFAYSNVGAVSGILGPDQPLDSESSEDPALYTHSNDYSEVSVCPDEPPRFVIDMSLPPEQRYNEVATAMKGNMRGLVHLFDDVMSGLIWFLPLFLLRLICKLLLRRVYNGEEMAELRGISTVTGLEVYLLVTFNVLLDMLMGCSSGGALVGDANGSTKMLHFRTLDWGMTDLRRIVVRLEYVHSKDEAPFASSVTYAGFVGVLTGVRKGLSVSLNFRRTRLNKDDWLSNLKFSWHKISVLLGRRPSIASLLRGYLLNRTSDGRYDYDLLISILKSPHCCTTACYLTLCNGKEVTVFEKDRISAVTRSSEIFENVTNHDAGAEHTTNKTNLHIEADVTGLEMLVDESAERRQCSRDNYTALLNSQYQRTATHQENGPLSRTEAQKRIAARLLSQIDIINMVQRYPCTNEGTHYATVMDPTAGEIVWCRRWKEPIAGPESHF